MTATGLKAAPRSRKIRMAIWRFCAGHPLRPAPPSSRVQTASSPPHFPPEARLTVAAPEARPQVSSAPPAPGRKLLIFTDAWAPQVNGVVRTLETLGQDLRSLGWDVRYATPSGHRT